MKVPKYNYAVKNNLISNLNKALFYLVPIVVFGSFLNIQSYRKVVSSIDSVSPIESDRNYELTGDQMVYIKANSLTPVTDKVWPHSYQIMYGQFLLPFYKRKPNMKFLEVGLGCGMPYGPGASVALWRKLIPKAEIWEADSDTQCVKQARKDGLLDGINTVTGNQGDVKDLDRWIEETGGGKFDVVVDDGSHLNCHIWTTFLKFWPLMKPGGLYFIENIHVGRTKFFSSVETQLCTKDLIVADKMKSILERLTIKGGERQRDEDIEDIKDVKFIFCQKEGCVLGKDEKRYLRKRYRSN